MNDCAAAHCDLGSFFLVFGLPGHLSLWRVPFWSEAVSRLPRPGRDSDWNAITVPLVT
jgi:hypothetical protein